jgi:hypothetical protein
MDAFTKKLNNPYVLSGAIAASYFAFYTAYDKKSKSLVFSNLTDLVTGNRGLDWSLVEANKALSLTGMTTMMVAFLPEAAEIKKDLLKISMVTLWGHSVYSFYKFYEFDYRKVISEKLMKKLSVVLGSAATFSLAAGVFEQFTGAALAVTTTILGVAHFYTMEIDYKYVLQVRPFAYLPFPVAALVLYSAYTGRSLVSEEKLMIDEAAKFFFSS